MNTRDIFPRTLQYLIAIAEHGNFTRAAEALCVSQPTLSQQIKQLEETLEIPLLDRSSRQVRLTDAGATYLYHARRACSELEAGTRAILDVQNLSRGTLRIGWTPITDYMTCTLIEKFHIKYPAIKLTTLEMPADQIAIAIAEDRIDYGIAFNKPALKNSSKLHEIQARTLFKEPLCVAVGNDHPRAGQLERISVKELGRENLILLNQDFALRRTIDQYLHDHGITPIIAMQTDSLRVIIEMIQLGPLVTLLPETIVHSQCGIHQIRLAPSLPLQEITVISRTTGYKNPASTAFEIQAQIWSESRYDVIPSKYQRPCPYHEPIEIMLEETE
jgi:LysR family transcriptional regulator, cyn operon transcriptional activator